VQRDVENGAEGKKAWVIEPGMGQIGMLTAPADGHYSDIAIVGDRYYLG
jgi:hypothetical protein